MKTHFGIFTFVVIAGIALFAGRTLAVNSPPAGKLDDPRVAELAKEVSKKGWIVYAARALKEDPAPEAIQEDWDLFIMRPDGSGIYNITNTPMFNEGLPRFSPDARRILYRRIPISESFDNNLHGMQGELVFADSDGGNAEVFGEQGEYMWASWGPEGKRIACMSVKGIYFVELATKKVVGRLERRGFSSKLPGRRMENGCVVLLILLAPIGLWPGWRLPQAPQTPSAA